MAPSTTARSTPKPSTLVGIRADRCRGELGHVRRGGGQAGLRPGDVVEAVDGRSVRSVAELATRLYGDSPGTQLLVTVHRGGTTFAATLALELTIRVPGRRPESGGGAVAWDT